MFLFCLLYNIVLTISAIILLPVILIAFLIKPKLRAGFFKKLGFYNFKKLNRNKKTIVFHAVSVGETNALEALIKRTRNEFPDANIILTTTTRTGQEIAHKKLKDTVTEITYFPYDLAFSVLSFLKNAKPDVILIAETEIWPDFVYISNKMNIPVYIVNGRISPHSYNGYKKFSFFFKPVLNLYKGILMQTEADAQRIRDIGANIDKVECMGNLKFDINQNIDEKAIEELKEELQPSRLIIAASTHKGEDEIILKAFTDIKKEFTDTKMMIAPRHPERYAQVEELIKNTGLQYGKRSAKDNFSSNDIIMLDTMGELMKMFSVCDFAFIGGSFSTTGGHNPLEANIWGKPVISGDCVFNFKDIYAYLTKTKAATLVTTGEELKTEMKKLLSDRTYYEAACADALKIFEENRGAVDFVINVLKNNTRL